MGDKDIFSISDVNGYEEVICGQDIDNVVRKLYKLSKIIDGRSYVRVIKSILSYIKNNKAHFDNKSESEFDRETSCILSKLYFNESISDDEFDNVIKYEHVITQFVKFYDCQLIEQIEEYAKSDPELELYSSRYLKLQLPLFNSSSSFLPVCTGIQLGVMMANIFFEFQRRNEITLEWITHYKVKILNVEIEESANKILIDCKRTYDYLDMHLIWNSDIKVYILNKIKEYMIEIMRTPLMITEFDIENWLFFEKLDKLLLLDELKITMNIFDIKKLIYISSTDFIVLNYLIKLYSNTVGSGSDPNSEVLCENYDSDEYDDVNFEEIRTNSKNECMDKLLNFITENYKVLEHEYEEAKHPHFKLNDNAGLIMRNIKENHFGEPSSHPLLSQIARVSVSGALFGSDINDKNSNKVCYRIKDDDDEDIWEITISYNDNRLPNKLEFEQLKTYCSYFENIKLHFEHHYNFYDQSDIDWDLNSDPYSNQISLKVDKNVPGTFVNQIIEFIGFNDARELCFEYSAIESVINVLDSCLTTLNNIRIIRLENLESPITIECLNTLSRFQNLESLSLSWTEIGDFFTLDPDDDYEWIYTSKPNKLPNLRLLGLDKHHDVNQNLIKELFPNAIVIYT